MSEQDLRGRRRALAAVMIFFLGACCAAGVASWSEVSGRLVFYATASSRTAIPADRPLGPFELLAGDRNEFMIVPSFRTPENAPTAFRVDVDVRNVEGESVWSTGHDFDWDALSSNRLERARWRVEMPPGLTGMHWISSTARSSGNDANLEYVIIANRTRTGPTWALATALFVGSALLLAGIARRRPHWLRRVP